jgi:pyruvate dehydrogenase (quinone)
MAYMAKTVGDQVVERLHAWGVRRVFGYPGDGINGVMAALNRMSDKVEFIQARHEELAALMAVGHAKFTGEVGVCIATSGPGAIHLLNGLYDAKADHQPVVAIVGQQARAALGGEYQQEVDLLSLFKDVASEFVQMATVPAQVRHLIDRALRIALDQRTVTCVILPHDLQRDKAVEEPPRLHGTVHTGIGTTTQLSQPATEQLRAAAQLLNEGSRVAILAGAGALHATDELIEVAERLGAGIAKALLGKAAVPDDLPFVTGSIGLLGTQPSWEMMERCDTLLMVGTNFPYSEYLPPEGQARAVQIDIDGRRLGLRYPTEINLVGDSRATLQALLPLLLAKDDRRWREEIESNVAHW